MLAMPPDCTSTKPLPTAPSFDHDTNGGVRQAHRWPKAVQKCSRGADDCGAESGR